MSALDCVQVRDLAPEFALGVLDGETRADVVLHVDRCPTCRTAIADFAETADSIVLLAPEAEPPPGFERRVVERITVGGHRRRWRTVKLVAAVAAAAIIVSVVAVRVIDGNRAEPVTAPVPVTAPARPTVVPVIGEDGQRVGRVEVVEAGSSAALALSVDDALPDGEYRVVLDPGADGGRVLGAVTVTGGRGSWAGSTRLGRVPATLGLVDAGGAVQCSAALPAA